MTIKFQKLTRAGQRQFAEGQKIEEHGIGFERLSNGDGRYTINVMVDGQRIHRVVGKESDGVTRLQAEELIAKLRTDARHGRLNLPIRTNINIKNGAKKAMSSSIVHSINLIGSSNV